MKIRQRGVPIPLFQPPFVQLNSPYPACAFLKSFLGREGIASESHDLSIATTRSLFSATGLSRVFDAAEAMADEVARNRDKALRDNFLGYLSRRAEWTGIIDALSAFLSRHEPVFARRLLSLSVPYGFRTKRWLEAAGHSPAPGDEHEIATMMFEDIADFVSYAFDANFSLSRYGESLASSVAEFAPVREGAERSAVLNEFAAPIVAGIMKGHAGAPFACVTIPFPGCLAGALVTAREIRKASPDTKIIFGGGYVSTELRHMKTSEIFGYADYLCFDSGFGALRAFIEAEGATADSGAYYRTVALEGGTLHACGMTATDNDWYSQEPLWSVVPCAGDTSIAALEAKDRVALFPDYRGSDFSSYLKIRETKNPMHALWSDTTWLKAYAASGCYWAKCSFCDGTLDYISRYAKATVANLYEALLEQAKETGVFGIHLTDEAAPPASLAQFALENIARGNPLVFWGNTRFEKSFDRDLCELLYEGGFLAVSAGIEAAGGNGLETARKGLSLADIIGSLTSFKEAGILTHGYLMYGLPGQSETDIIDSAEIVRQLFECGLLDSAFWHRFTLTRHSLMYRDFLLGQLPGLKPIIPEHRFALNDLSFEGAEKYLKYDDPLDRMLASWLSGDSIDNPVSSWFRKAPSNPSVSDRLVSDLIGTYRERRSIPDDLGRQACWLGGIPSIHRDARGNIALSWSYRNTMHRLKCDEPMAEFISRFLLSARGPKKNLPRLESLQTRFPDEADTITGCLRENGLVLLR